jgi:hypothetical protein
MSVTIDNTLTLPVTSDQAQAFKTWATQTYSDYAAYNVEASKNNNAINHYIIAHILPLEIKTILDESAPFVRSRTTDPRIKELQLNRKLIHNKVRYMKNKLGKLAFREEAQQLREESDNDNRRIAEFMLQDLRREREEEQRRFREELILGNDHLSMDTLQEYFNLTTEEREREESRRRQEEEIRLAERMRIMNEHIRRQFGANLLTVVQEQPLHERIRLLHAFELNQQFLRQRRQRRQPQRQTSVKYTKTTISKAEAQLHMVDDCCICMDKHTLNSVVKGHCGHVIGANCFKEWASKCTHNKVSCPMCRADCNEVLEMTECN